MIALLMGLPTISPGKLRERMERERIHVYDVNAEPRWLDARVPGARHLDPLGFTASDLPEDSNAPIVFYCSNPMCRKAPNAAKRAKQMGYSNVFVMAAGITGWMSASLPTESGRPASV